MEKSTLGDLSVLSDLKNTMAEREAAGEAKPKKAAKKKKEESEEGDEA